MKFKTDEADRLFSLWIRRRDKQTCAKCGRKFHGEPGLSNAHFYGRSKESTRFEPDNCDSLCYPGCHLYWQNNAREDYRAFKLKQLGQKRFNSLLIQSNTYKKKDRAMERIKWREALKEL